MDDLPLLHFVSFVVAPVMILSSMILTVSGAEYRVASFGIRDASDGLRGAGGDWLLRIGFWRLDCPWESRVVRGMFLGCGLKEFEVATSFDLRVSIANHEKHERHEDNRPRIARITAKT